MRSVIAYELLSLDGVAEGPDGFVTDWDGAMQENLARVIDSQDTVLLGRKTYEEWATFWPGSDIQPFSRFVNGVQKLVATSTPLDRDWQNSRAIDGEVTAFVADLKQHEGRDIGVHGSISLVQTLLAAQLVDELRLVVAPSVHVEGRKLFDGAVPTRLSLTRSVASPAGYLLLDFEIG
jgi:dihydrofolate reductase